MLSTIRSSLRHKVTAVIVTATVAALLVSAAAVLTLQARQYRAQLLGDIVTQAGILARMNGPALAFDDPTTAQNNLSILDARPDILSAGIYTATGETFATYSRAERYRPPSSMRGVVEPTFEDGELVLSYVIVEEGNVLGSVYLRAQGELASRLLDYVLILGTVLLVILLAAAFVSLALQRSVTNPILTIADVARKVIKERDFTLRARKTTQDEIGALVDAFNAMLAEVGEHQHALEATNRRLRVESEERRKAESALRAADNRKDEFLATLAHELRNPLAPMVNSLSLVRSRQADGELVDRAHDIIDRQLTHMVRLVDDLVDVSRITRGKLELRSEPTTLQTAVQAAVDTVRPLVEARGQQLSVAVPERPVHLVADPTRLAQIFSNLLDNAAKYTPEGGHIRLDTDVGAGLVRVTIIDEGIGIASDETERIFEMFSQTGNDNSQPGLGVGLALARRLVELHRGTIEAASAGLGRGSRFTVALPVAAAAEPAHDAPRAESAATVPLRILLVDDNVDFAASLQILLQQLGHDVRVAHEAAEALTLVRQSTFDVAFLDIGLPLMDGYELARRMRELSSDITLIAVTGWGQEKDRRRSSEAGFVMHLVKPVQVDRIRAALDTLLAVN